MNDYEGYGEAAQPAKRRARPEHLLQVAIVKWCRSQIAEPHVLLCFDRSKPSSARAHLYEAQRGVVAGTPDAAILFSGARQVCWVELKAGKGKQSENQKTMEARLLAIGHPYRVIYSVEELYNWLAGAGVRLAGTAAWAAADADARLQGPRPEPVAKKPRKARAPREDRQAALHVYTRLGAAKGWKT